MTCSSFSQLFMKLCVYLSRRVTKRNKNMWLDLVRIYKEQGFQLKGNRESCHLMFKISKFFSSAGPPPPTLSHQLPLPPTFHSWFLVSSLISGHILKKVSLVVKSLTIKQCQAK